MKLLKKIRSDLTLTIEPETALTYIRNFHENFSFVIVLGQIFGLMPLTGMSSINIQDVRFKWNSFRFAYSVFNIAGSFIMAMFTFFTFAIYGLQLDKSANITFYVLSFFGAYQFIQIGRNWNRVLKEWCYVEVSMRNYGSIPNMKKRFVLITLIVLFLALTEHSLFILSCFSTSSNCGHFQIDPYRVYFGIEFPFIFSLIDYSLWKAVLAKIVNILATFTWNYIDLFIILISCALAARFSQINKRLKDNIDMRESFWKEIRVDYNRVTYLTRVVDRYLSPLVFASFINNTFLICVQLYNSLKIRVGYAETLYYFYSFGFLIARTVAVTLYGAWVNDESKRSLQILQSVPSDHYCLEIRRLILQINTSPIGISASRFFIVSRGVLLKMVSTIVTFEIMFLKFGPSNRTVNQYEFDLVFECYG